MIGARCTLCKKQKHHHFDSRKGSFCPVGKLSAQEFHLTNVFTPRPAKPRSSRLSPVAKRGGSRLRKDTSVRREIKAQPCVACGAGNCDPAHIRGWQISQCDAAFNITSFCRAHHVQQSNRGWYWMALRYPTVAKELEAKGWQFVVNESTGDWGMWNAHEVEFNRARRAV